MSADHSPAAGPTLHPAARALLESEALAHLVTLNPDGSSQVSCILVGLDGDEIVSGHLARERKLDNVESDPRVALSIEGGGSTGPLQDYLVVHGRARLQEGGAPELLQRLAIVYLAPEAIFSPVDDPPPGYVMRITPVRTSGVGPWA